MKILVTGATGYVGGRLVPRLVAEHDVHVLVRDASRVQDRSWSADVTVHEGDVSKPETLAGLGHFDAAYYLIHSMTADKHFAESDAQYARNFTKVDVDHIIYLGGLMPKGKAREHLASRAEVGQILAASHPTTEFRAGPIIGSGSASFEMCRYLTERLPVMITPSWVRNKVSPISIRDILSYLVAALDVGPSKVVDLGTESLGFGDMMKQYAEVRGLSKRRMLPTPILAPRLAARWVGFITPIPNTLAVPIIDGVRTDLLADPRAAKELFPNIEPMPYKEAVRLALQKLADDDVETRWSTALSEPGYVVEDEQNVIKEIRTLESKASPKQVMAVVQSLGGETGWLAWNWTWRLRGGFDRMIGGPGLRRGRRSSKAVHVGEAIDWWRVEEATQTRLRLRAEMKVPGKAWLQFDVEPTKEGSRLTQTAFFEPHGLPGVLYWKVFYPIHRFIFRDMAKAIAKRAES